MTCRHTRSSVSESREEGDERYASTDFRYYKIRRRVCQDCGQRFTTYELTDIQVDQLQEDAKHRINKIHKQLRSILEIEVTAGAG